jgi:tetratricopeptide (TPR) repeat protein
MNFLDRLRGSSAKKETPSRLLHQEEAWPDTSLPTTEGKSSVYNSEQKHRQQQQESVYYRGISPKEKHTPSSFHWGIRRKRKESLDEAENNSNVSTPTTPKVHDIYTETKSGSTGTKSVPPVKTTTPQLKLEAARKGSPHTAMPAKALFAGTPLKNTPVTAKAKADPAIEAPLLTAATSSSTASPSSASAIPHQSAINITTTALDSDGEEEWDYENDIPLYVDEEDEAVVHRILMMQTPKALKRFASGGDNTSANELEHADLEHERALVTRAVAALDKAGNELFAQGRYEDAFLRYERALLLKKRTLADGDADEKPESNGSHLNKHHHSGTKEQKANILASVATSINNITYIKQRTGQASNEETMASYLKSLQIKRDILGPDHLSVGKTLNNIGSVFYLKKEYDPALTAYKDAYRIMEHKLGSDHLDVGTVVSNVGDVYFALGDKAEAQEHYNRALDIRWSKLGSKDPKVVRLMQQVAMLETGVQPDVEMCAEGVAPEEAEIIREMERHRMSVFIEDIQKLQAEVKEDMKFFDLAERQLEIDLVKDRMRIFREMRDLYNATDEFNIEDSLKESIKVIPGLADQLKKLQNHEYDDVYDEPLDDVDANPNSNCTEDPLQVATPQVTDETAQSPTPALMPAAVLVQLPLKTDEKPNESDLEHSVAEQDENVDVSIHGSAEFEKLALQAPAVTPQHPETPRKVLHNAVGQIPAQAPLTPPAPLAVDNAAKLFSPGDRQAALEGVRERLDRLRRERDEKYGKGRTEQSVDDGVPRLEARRRSYMFPTIASAAKSMTPKIKKLRRVQQSWNRRGTPKKVSVMSTTTEGIEECDL